MPVTLAELALQKFVDVGPVRLCTEQTMRNVIKTLQTPIHILQRLYSSHDAINIQRVPTLSGSIDSIDVQLFRQRAFASEEAILLTSKHDAKNPAANSHTSGLPASFKWFELAESGTSGENRALSQCYLSPFGTTILPYEFIVESNKSYTDVVDSRTPFQSCTGEAQNLSKLLNELSKGSPEGAFHRFNAPLSLFLHASKLRSTPRLYIAQAQIADLPKELQDDLPIPRLVKEAGLGDVYDSSIWMGMSSTYTPLHKDPNPNLFVQLAGSKSVRLFRPNVGSAIYRDIQQRIGQSSSSSFRGEEMMEGPERHALDKAVWDREVQAEGYEAIVNAGDALFIPKGWWHSVKSVCSGMEAYANVSVNWWFR